MSLAASGNAARSATQDLDLRLEAALSDLAKLSPALAGTLKVSGKLNGPEQLAEHCRGPDNDTVDPRIAARYGVSLRPCGRPAQRRPQGTVEAHGDLDGAPLHLNVSVERGKDDVVHAVIHHADWKSAHIEGDFTSGADVARGAWQSAICAWAS